MLRATLLRGVGVVALASACFAGPAQAQVSPAPHLQPPSRVPGAVPLLRGPQPVEHLSRPDDGLGPKDTWFEADSLIDNRTDHTIIAEGHVETRYAGRTLRADKIVYNSVTGAVHATGNVVIIGYDGATEFASDLEVDDQFRAGVALNFSARLQNNVTIVAGAALRRSETVVEMHGAAFTPCDICNEGGKPKTPTWSIQAERIVADQAHQVIYYRNAVIRVLGAPVLYTPYFWHPMPAVKRSSGLLTPRFDLSRRRGLSYEQPLLLVLSPSSDLTISPQINTDVNPLLNLRYRQRFWSGEIDLRAGYTHEALFDDDHRFGANTNRSYILSRGAFQIDRNWSWGFAAERATDPTFFRRYAVPHVFAERGPYLADTDRLISQLYVKRQDEQSYLSVAGLGFQSLRASLNNGTLVQADSNATFPTALPVVEAKYDPAASILGGRLRVSANAVNLGRNNTVISVTDPTGGNVPGPQAFNTRPSGVASLTYKDARQASLAADWRTMALLSNGLRIEPFLVARGDVFSIGDGVLSTNGITTGKAKSTVGRGFGVVGADISWPFIKPVGNGALIIEPLVQLAASPRLKLDPNIPNEDSLGFRFDDSTLFSVNRFSGIDAYEGGFRANLGARATLSFGNTGNASLLVGRTYRSEPELAFSATSGLQGKTSDWVTAVTVTPFQGLSFYNRARLDAETLNVRRDEAGVNLSRNRSFLSLRYLYDENGVVPTVSGQSTVGRVETLDLYGATFITKHWGVSANLSRDLAASLWPTAQVGVFYEDECLRLDFLYTHDDTYSATIGASDSISVRLTLTTLGNTNPVGYKAGDNR